MARPQVETIIVTAKRVEHDSSGGLRLIIQLSFTLRGGGGGAVSSTDGSSGPFTTISEVLEAADKQTKLTFVDETGRLPEIVISPGLDRPEIVAQTIIAVTAAVLGGKIDELGGRIGEFARSLITKMDELKAGGIQIRYVEGDPPGQLRAWTDPEKHEDPATGQMFYQIVMSNYDLSRQDNSTDAWRLVTAHELFHVGRTSNEEFLRLQSLNINATNHDKAFDAMVDRILRKSFQPEIEWQLQMDSDGAVRTSSGGIERILGQESSTLDYSLSVQDITIFDAGGNDTYRLGSGYDMVYDDGGDDTYIVTAGAGIDIVSDNGGHDILYFTTQSNSALRVEKTGLTLFIGSASTGVEDFRPAHELQHRVEIDLDAAGVPDVEVYVIDGVTYSRDAIIALSNSRPYFEGEVEHHIQAPFTGGAVAFLGAVDPDGDTLSIQIQSVGGHGQGWSWWVSDGWLYTNARWTSQDHSNTQVIVRASDGVLSQHHEIYIHWEPDPFGDEELNAPVVFGADASAVDTDFYSASLPPLLPWEMPIIA